MKKKLKRVGRTIKKKLSLKERGFTIIEVVLVLAIAGLIFIMVFIALPALQASQRNQQRRRDVAMIRAAFEQWKKNNKKSVTDSFTSRNDANGFCTFYKRYLGEEFKDPTTGEPYKVALWGSTNVVDCITGEVFPRDGYDPDVHGSAHSGETDNWAKMEVGDIQFDDTAYCTEDGGFEDDVSKKLGTNVYSGTRLYAIRIRLENGASVCVDGAY